VSKVVLITGAAKRIGAACVQSLHAEGFNVVLHYHASDSLARELMEQLNAVRSNSVVLVKADLSQLDEVLRLAEEAEKVWGGLNALVNNASLFAADTVGQVSEAHWDGLMATNLKAPFFLSQALAPALSKRTGCIVNIADIHAERGLPGYCTYSIAKAGLVAMTKALAKELAPNIRVNAVSPGAILWPENAENEAGQAEILQKVPLQRCGTVDDIAKAVRFLVCEADYMTGQVLTVDGGRLLFS
jgi:pteridine reductase